MDEFCQEHGHDAPAFHTDCGENADLARALEDRHDQRIDNDRGRHRKHDQVKQAHIRVGHIFGLDDDLVHLRPGQDLVARSLQRVDYRIGLVFILQQDKDRAGMVLRSGSSPGLFPAAGKRWRCRTHGSPWSRSPGW